MSERLTALAEAGVSIWLDDLSRERIETGNLAELVKNSSVVGVTTNPTIFATALSDGERYDDQLRGLVEGGASIDDAIFELTTTDVRNACDVLSEAFSASDGVDGRVSIEVPPGLAFDTRATVEAAEKLWAAVDRPNLFIKIPATRAGLPAITAVLAEGISVNVTLIFSLERYGAVIDAFHAGVEQAKANGKDVSDLQSVASFFVSRVDSEIDKRLDKIGSSEAKALQGKAAVANARLAYKLYEEKFSGDRWKALSGANPQRPLWASTSTKNPEYRDVIYVEELIAPGTVNTVPEPVIHAFAEHGEVKDSIRPFYEQAEREFAQLSEVGIDLDDVFETLEREGVEKFEASYAELLDGVQKSLDAASKGADKPNKAAAK
jgi:transaldolase